MRNRKSILKQHYPKNERPLRTYAPRERAF